MDGRWLINSKLPASSFQLECAKTKGALETGNWQLTLMMLSLISFLESWANSRWMVYIRDSSFGMPALQSVHLVGLTMLLATMLVLNLRLAGLTMMDWSLPSLERQLRPWALGAIAMVIASGIIMFLGNPAKYLASYPFLFKMTALSLAILFQVRVLRRLPVAEAGSRPRRTDVVVAALALTLWFAVGWAGRAIAFV